MISNRTPVAKRADLPGLGRPPIALPRQDASRVDSYRPGNEGVAAQNSSMFQSLRVAVRPRAKWPLQGRAQLSETLKQVASQALQVLNTRAQNALGFHTLMQRAFANTYEQTVVEGFRQRLLSGDASWLPHVRMVEGASSYRGAYLQATQTIAINGRFQTNDEALQIYLEELGHHLDALLFRGDSQGDEGERFRRLLSGEPYETIEASPSVTRDDRGVLFEGGIAFAAEFWESDEHRVAVNEAVTTLEAQSATLTPALRAAVSEAARLLRHSTVDLGLQQSFDIGTIAALMGDYYGAYQGDAFDASRAVYELCDANQSELQNLRDAFDREKRGVRVSAAEYQRLSVEMRANGRLSYLDLAQQNGPHFSSANGAVDNLGTYRGLHRAALIAAEAHNKEGAVLLEACAMHFLTDRFASGHQFDKSTLTASGTQASLKDNLSARYVHDKLNQTGIVVSDSDGAEWKALGDGQFSADANRDNRLHAAVSIALSWAEVSLVLQGKATGKEIEIRGYAALNAAPRFDQATQTFAQELSHRLSWATLIRANAQDIDVLLNIFSQTVSRALSTRKPLEQSREPSLACAQAFQALTL